MAGYPGETNQPQTQPPPAPQKRAVWPWILLMAFVTFTIGLLANPWFEREIRTRLPFGTARIDESTLADRQQGAQLAEVSQRLQTLEKTTPASRNSEERAVMSDQAARLDALEKRFETLDNRSTTALANSARAEGMLLALAARRAIDTGQPLGVIEGMLRERFGGSQPQAVSALVLAGQKPVTLSQLQAGLQTLEPQLQQASRGDSWLSDLRSDLANLVIFKRESAPIAEPVEQLKDARQRLMVGDVAGALWQVNRLPPNARSKANRWIDAARRYLVARQALDTLETVALLAPPPGSAEQVIPLPSAPAAPQEPAAPAPANP